MHAISDGIISNLFTCVGPKKKKKRMMPRGGESNTITDKTNADHSNKYADVQSSDNFTKWGRIAVRIAVPPVHYSSIPNDSRST